VYRRVTTGMLVRGMRVIEDGVKPTDKVVVQGLQRVKEGTTVVPEPYAPESPEITTVSAPAKVKPKVDSPIESAPSAFPPRPATSEDDNESKDEKKTGP